MDDLFTIRWDLGTTDLYLSCFSPNGSALWTQDETQVLWVNADRANRILSMIKHLEPISRIDVVDKI